jgi:hypothetical protein
VPHFADATASPGVVPLWDANGAPAAQDDAGGEAFAPAVLPLLAATDRALAHVLAALLRGWTSAGAAPPTGAALAAAAAARAATAATSAAAPPPLPDALVARRFPTGAWGGAMSPSVVSVLVGIVPISLTFLFSLQLRVLLTSVLEEKERGVAGVLGACGAIPKMYWASWGATALVKNLAVVTIAVAAVTAGGVFARADASLVWVLFALFAVACIVFVIGASALLRRAASGGALGMLAWLALAAPSYALARGALDSSSGPGAAAAGVPLGGKLVVCVLSAPTAFNFAVALLVASETTNDAPLAALGAARVPARPPIGWGTAWNADVTPLGVPFAAVLLALVGAILL